MKQEGSFLAEAFLENTNNTDLYGLHGTRMLAHIQKKCMYKCSKNKKSLMHCFVTTHLRGGVSLQFAQRAKEGKDNCKEPWQQLWPLTGIFRI